MLLLYKTYNYINKQKLFLKLSRGSWVEGRGSRGKGVEGVFEIPHGMSLASFIQSHALAQASQAVGQRYRRWASKNPTLVQCKVLAVLSYHWTGTLLGQR